MARPIHVVYQQFFDDHVCSLHAFTTLEAAEEYRQELHDEEYLEGVYYFVESVVLEDT